VGREEELGVLLSIWERTCRGEGQVALIIGEPGIGKSRIVKEFHDRIRDAPHIWMEAAGEQFFENTPFHAVIEMLSRSLELQHVGNTEEQLERLEQALTLAGISAAESAQLIADLLQLPAGERYPASALSAEQKRRRLLAALSGWVLGSAKGQPLVMMVEDLHWLDPSSLELLQLLGEQGATAPLMLLYTARPEFRAPWPMRAHHSQITLNRLSSRDVRDMVALVTVRNALPSESIDVLVERTGGVPLFVEELTRAVLESGSTRVTVREIPATLHDSAHGASRPLGSCQRNHSDWRRYWQRVFLRTPACGASHRCQRSTKRPPQGGRCGTGLRTGIPTGRYLSVQACAYPGRRVRSTAQKQTQGTPFANSGSTGAEIS
jgi:predicted ATPase